MLHVLDVLRIRYGGRPVLITVVAFAVLQLLARQPRLRMALASRFGYFLRLGGFAGLLAYPVIALWYAGSLHFFDNAEPTIISVAWMYHLGHPVYHDFFSAARYSHIYGPALFMIHSAALSWFGPSIVVSKLVGALSGLACLWLIFAAARRHCSRESALALTAYSALFLLTFRNYSFWTRPDSLQLAAVAASVYFADVRDRRAALLLSAAAFGLLWNLKFTGPLYSLPTLVVLTHRFGLRATAACVVAATALALAPFVLASNVSWVNYLGWIRVSGQTGLLLALLRQNMEWAVFMGMPILAIWYSSLRGQPAARWEAGTIGALVISLVGLVVAGSKPGAGPYHLMPLLPAVVRVLAKNEFLFSNFVPTLTGSLLVAAQATTLVLLALVQQAQFVSTIVERDRISDVQDITSFLRSHPQTVEMAYGRTEALSLARPLLTFHNGSYLIDQPAVREHQLQGIEIPAATMMAIDRCDVSYWLVPRGELPFTGANGYAAVFLRPLYSAEFRRSFLSRYVRDGQTEHFDVWRCVSAPR